MLVFYKQNASGINLNIQQLIYKTTYKVDVLTRNIKQSTF